MPPPATTPCVRGIAIAAIVITIAAGACVPLPIPHTEYETPAIEALVVRDDGLPAAGRTIGVRESKFNRGCAGPRARATTDSLGRVVLPEASGHERVLWLTLMEHFDLTWFDVCELAAATAGDSVIAQSGTVTGSTRGTKLSCLEWSWADTLRLACASDRVQRADDPSTGGTWRDGADSGQYRLIAFDAPHCRGERVVVQWLSGGQRVPHPVRATRELERGKRCLPDGKLALDQIGDTTVVRLSPYSGRALTWALGPPGTVARRERQ